MTIQKVHFSLADWNLAQNKFEKKFWRNFENLEGLTFNLKIRIRILIREIWKGQDWPWSFKTSNESLFMSHRLRYNSLTLKLRIPYSFWLWFKNRSVFRRVIDSDLGKSNDYLTLKLRIPYSFWLWLKNRSVFWPFEKKMIFGV